MLKMIWYSAWLLTMKPIWQRITLTCGRYTAVKIRPLILEMGLLRFSKSKVEITLQDFFSLKGLVTVTLIQGIFWHQLETLSFRCHKDITYNEMGIFEIRHTTWGPTPSRAPFTRGRSGQSACSPHQSLVPLCPPTANLSALRLAAGLVSPTFINPLALLLQTSSPCQWLWFTTGNVITTCLGSQYWPQGPIFPVSRDCFPVVPLKICRRVHLSLGTQQAYWPHHWPLHLCLQPCRARYRCKHTRKASKISGGCTGHWSVSYAKVNRSLRLLTPVLYMCGTGVQGESLAEGSYADADKINASKGFSKYSTLVSSL